MNKIFGKKSADYRKFRNLLLAASILTFLLIVLGGTVCMTGSTLGCPDWPGCFGQVIPPLQVNAIIEYAHRFVAALSGVVILASAVAAWRKYRTTWIRLALVVTVILLAAVVVFGAFAVLTGLARGVAAVDLGSALLVLALVLALTTAVFRSENPANLSLQDPFARLGMVTLAATFLVLVSAVLVAPSGSIIRCLGWPLLSSVPLAAGGEGSALLVREVLAGAAILLSLATLIQAWRTLSKQPGILPAALVMGACLVVEVALGLVIRAGGHSDLLLVSYVVAAAGNWSALVVMEQLAISR